MDRASRDSRVSLVNVLVNCRDGQGVGNTAICVTVVVNELGGDNITSEIFDYVRVQRICRGPAVGSAKEKESFGAAIRQSLHGTSVVIGIHDGVDIRSRLTVFC